jgi:hypothetical protein
MARSSVGSGPLIREFRPDRGSRLTDREVKSHGRPGQNSRTAGSNLTDRLGRTGRIRNRPDGRSASSPSSAWTIAIAEPINDSQRNDLATWMAGPAVGATPSSRLNPVLHRRD